CRSSSAAATARPANARAATPPRAQNRALRDTARVGRGTPRVRQAFTHLPAGAGGACRLGSRVPKGGVPVIIGVPTEVKTREYRVGINPGGVLALVRAGHSVRIQSGAGMGSGITDDDFQGVGAQIVPSAADAWGAGMVMRVKEPLPQGQACIPAGLLPFTCLRHAPQPE